MMLLLAILLLLAAALGAPLFAVIAGVAMLGFQSVETPLTVMGIELYRIVDTPILLALPLFTFAGYMLGESRTSVRLVRITQSLIGWMPGGLAIVAFLTCAFCSGIGKRRVIHRPYTLRKPIMTSAGSRPALNTS